MNIKNIIVTTQNEIVITIRDLIIAISSCKLLLVSSIIKELSEIHA